MATKKRGKLKINAKSSSKKPTPPKSLREKIQFYLIDCKTLPGKFIDMFILILNLLICLTFVLETYPISEIARGIIWKIEVVTIIFFIIEYIARIYGASNRVKEATNVYTIIDLLAILPTITIILFPVYGANITFIKILRVFKVLRIFRFLRFTADPYFFFGNITWHFLKVVRLVFTIFIIFFISAGLFFHVENGINSVVNNFGDAFYYVVVTITTVGFGDIIPISDGGRIVTVLMIISGIILIPWQASQVIKEWSQTKKKKSTCKNCGLMYHDEDASHCKSCGHIIYQEYDNV
ncbi:ion transporter [Candidatus Woesearchaeota archaeon]|jgi:voltage-gated potassium channel|nr:ion transporter [Candidatus Woesearchaeota archaeon]MBT6520428.1 ion transporter [Candidatus Woesearchaeota archaeon]MBT7368834.1 ion transporter [Candidatus Woesearchaeota archaeon]